MPSDDLLRIENGQRLRALARDFRELGDGKLLRKQLRIELKRAATPIVQAEKAAVQSLPSQEQNADMGRPSLRRNVARATQARIRMTGPRAGLLVWVNPRRMAQGKENLPGYLEGLRPFHRWRHPTFGHDPWVTQRPRPWFYRTAARQERTAQQAAARAIATIATRIESRR